MRDKVLSAPPYQLDLARPLPALVGNGLSPVLVRRHREPLGVLKLELSAVPFPEATLTSLLKAEFAYIPAEGEPTESVDVASVDLPSVSVVVNAIKANDALLRVLDSCLAQTVKPAEIVVVDNRPATSGLCEFLKEKAPCDYTYVAEPQAGLSAARNAGLAVIDSELVVFSDDDVVLDPHWLQELLSGFSDAAVACVTGLILPLELTTPAQRLLEEFGGFSKGYQHKRFDLLHPEDNDPLYPFLPGRFGSGANTAFRTAFLRSIGGFDQALGTGTPARGGEDLDIYLEVLGRGGVIVYRPGAVIWHSHRETMEDLNKQIFNYGIGVGAMMSKRLATRPAERKEILRRCPPALRYLMSSSSEKNAGKTHAYPRRLNYLEYAGLATGPFAYWRARHRLAQLTTKLVEAKTISILCTDVELSNGLKPTTLPKKGQALRLLVRLYGEPLGFLELPHGQLNDDDMARLLEAQIGPRVQNFLAEKVHSNHAASPDEAAAEDTTFVSVVLCTRDRAEMVRGCLRDLSQLLHTNLEFVVVDNAPSNNDTRRAFDEVVGHDPRFRYVVEPRPGLSRARNTGVRSARGDVVAFTDDDVEVDALWVQGLLRGFRRSPDVACVTGLVATAAIEGPAEAFFDSRVAWASSCTPRVFYRDDATAGPLHPWGAGQFGTGANFAFRTDVLRRLGGFDEALGAGSPTKGGEDLDIFVRVLLAHQALAYEPFALVWHIHRADVEQLREQMFSYGLGLGAYLTKHLLERSSATDMLVKAPTAVRHMYGVINRPIRQSGGRGTDSMSHLRRAELRGLASGPLAYLKARRAEAHGAPGAERPT